MKLLNAYNAVDFSFPGRYQGWWGFQHHAIR